MRPSPNQPRLAYPAGFSIFEVVVAFAAVAILAAVVLSTLSPESPSDRERYDAAAEGLAGLANAVAGKESSKTPRSFRQVVREYPGHLSDLTIPITQSSTNLCGISYTGPATTASSSMYNWTHAANPFYGRQLSSSTIAITIAPGFDVQDKLILSTTPVATSGSWANAMFIRLPSVAEVDAEALDLSVDGVIDGKTGIVRYTTASTTTQVDYITTISVFNTGILVIC